MTKNIINLPRVSEDGMPYISYSQVSSFNNPQYFNQYVLGYLFEIRDEGNIWSQFGSEVGEYLETSGEKIGKLLNNDDIKVLNEILKTLNTLEGKEFEKEIKLQRDGYRIIGYIDLYYETKEKANVVDFKTLNTSKKKSFYVNNDPDSKDSYLQTILYSRALEIEGKEIDNCGVFGIDRTFEGTFEEPILHLSGKAETIPTPYCKIKAEKFLTKVDETVKEISLLKTTFDTLKLLTITV